MARALLGSYLQLNLDRQMMLLSRLDPSSRLYQEEGQRIYNFWKKMLKKEEVQTIDRKYADGGLRLRLETFDQQLAESALNYRGIEHDSRVSHLQTASFMRAYILFEALKDNTHIPEGEKNHVRNQIATEFPEVVERPVIVREMGQRLARSQNKSFRQSISELDLSNMRTMEELNSSISGYVNRNLLTSSANFNPINILPLESHIRNTQTQIMSQIRKDLEDPSDLFDEPVLAKIAMDQIEEPLLQKQLYSSICKKMAEDERRERAKTYTIYAGTAVALASGVGAIGAGVAGASTLTMGVLIGTSIGTGVILTADNVATTTRAANERQRRYLQGLSNLGEKEFYDGLARQAQIFAFADAVLISTGFSAGRAGNLLISRSVDAGGSLAYGVYFASTGDLVGMATGAALYSGARAGGDLAATRAAQAQENASLAATNNSRPLRLYGDEDVAGLGRLSADPATVRELRQFTREIYQRYYRTQGGANKNENLKHVRRMVSWIDNNEAALRVAGIDPDYLRTSIVVSDLAKSPEMLARYADNFDGNFFKAFLEHSNLSLNEADIVRTQLGISDDVFRGVTTGVLGHDGPSVQGSWWQANYEAQIGREYQAIIHPQGFIHAFLDRVDQGGVFLRESFVGDPRSGDLVARQTLDGGLRKIANDRMTKNKVSLRDALHEAFGDVHYGTLYQLDYLEQNFSRFFPNQSESRELLNALRALRRDFDTSPAYGDYIRFTSDPDTVEIRVPVEGGGDAWRSASSLNEAFDLLALNGERIQRHRQHLHQIQVEVDHLVQDFTWVPGENMMFEAHAPLASFARSYYQRFADRANIHYLREAAPNLHPSHAAFLTFYSDHGPIHMSNIRSTANQLITHTEGLRPGINNEVLRQSVDLQTIVHDIGMGGNHAQRYSHLSDVDSFTRRMHPETAAQISFSDIPDINNFVNNFFSTSPATPLQAQIIEVANLSGVPRETVLREVLALSMGHSKSKIPRNLFSTDRHAELQMELRRNTFDRLDERDLIQRRQKAQRSGDTEKVSRLSEELEQVRRIPISEHEAYLEYLRRLYPDGNYEANSFAWLQGDDPILVNFRNHMIESMRTLSIADALRQRGMGADFILTNSSGAPIVLGPDGTPFVSLTGENGQRFRIALDKALARGEANIHRNGLTENGDLMIQLERGRFNSVEANTRVANDTGMVIEDMARDVLSSLPPVANRRRIIIQRPEQESYGFTEQVRSELVRNYGLSPEDVIIASRHIDPEMNSQRSQLTQFETERFSRSPANEQLNPNELNQAIEALQRSGFDVASPEALGSILNSDQVRTITLEAGDTLLHAGANSEYVYISLTGEFASPGNVLTGYEGFNLSPGALIGELGVFSGAERNMTIHSVDRARALAIPREIFMERVLRSYQLQSYENFRTGELLRSQ